MPQDNTQRRTGKPEHISKFDHGGRMPPRDNDLEEAVLGALMLEKDAYTAVCDILKPESFYEPANQKIYAAIQSLGAAQKSSDMLTVTEQLRLQGELEGAGVSRPHRGAEISGTRADTLRLTDRGTGI